MVTLAENGHPVFRATSLLSRGVLKSKGGGKLSIRCCADQETITTVFRTNTSANQLSLYGAVAEMCEEYESYHDRTVRPVVGGRSSSSFVSSVIKTNVPLNNDDPVHQELLLQRYGERIEKLSQQDRLSKFCTDAGFLTIVEVGQYFMAKDTGEFSQFTDSVACREYTLPRDEDTSEPKGWIRGALKLNAGGFASRSKAKAKQQKRDSDRSSTRTIPIGETTWTDVEPGNIRSPIIQCLRN